MEAIFEGSLYIAHGMLLPATGPMTPGGMDTPWAILKLTTNSAAFANNLICGGPEKLHIAENMLINRELRFRR